MKHHATDKAFAEKSRAARGFSSFRQWNEENRKAQGHLKASKRPQALIDTLERERKTLIAPFL